MYLADYHTHTRCSFDSQAELLDEALRAEQLGLREICTTDHCDLIDEHGQRVHALDWAPILAQYQSVRAHMEGKLTLRLGLELGCAQTDPDCARAILAGAPVDFVIGSIHNLSMERGGMDLFYVKYETAQDCYRALDDYFDSMVKLVGLPDTYDVLGHVIYPLRYMTGAKDGPVTLERYWDMLRSIFTAAAQAGRGIELNTYCGRTLQPWLEVLKLYRACGGEIVTTGSDAHSAENIGKGLPQAQQLLETAGFRYLTTYHQRTPQFVKL